MHELLWKWTLLHVCRMYAFKCVAFTKVTIPLSLLQPETTAALGYETAALRQSPPLYGMPQATTVPSAFSAAKELSDEKTSCTLLSCFTS